MRRPVLLPLVPLYAAGLALREMRLERQGGSGFESCKLPVPSIGNLCLSRRTLGKTPLAIAAGSGFCQVARGSGADVLSSRGMAGSMPEVAAARLTRSTVEAQTNLGMSLC